MEKRFIIEIMSGLKNKKLKALEADNKRLKKELDAALKKIAELEAKIERNNLSTPTSMQISYEKTVPKKKRRKIRGRKRGHIGSCRSKPDKIDNEKKWRVDKVCPFCGDTAPKKFVTSRKRYTEDIALKKSIVTEHTVERCRCGKCKKIITAPMTDALPGSIIGLHTLIVSAWHHYYCGMSLNKIVESFSITSFLKFSNGYLIQAWRRLSFILLFYYNQIQTEIQNSKYIHIDETGWRVFGENYWLWSFSNKQYVFFTINKTRGSTVIKELLGEYFNGIIISDFWIAYNKIDALAKQKCIVHLLRELKKVSLRNFSEKWTAFNKKLKRLIADAIRLSLAKDSLENNKFSSLRKRLDIRFNELCLLNTDDKDICRILKRWLIKYRGEFFTFVDMDIPKDNNFSEITIRNAVLLRKTSFGSQSLNGAQMAAVFLTVFATLKLNNINPVDFLIKSIKEYIKTNKLPALSF